MPTNRKNLDRASEIRADMAIHRIYRHQISAILGVSDTTVYRWMRNGLDYNHYSQIRAALDSLIEGSEER